MINIEVNRKKRINEIISIVKLASLLFCGIAIFNHYYGDNNIVIINSQFLNDISLGVSACILVLVYGLWSFSLEKRFQIKSIKIVRYIESIIFIQIFLTIILVSGNQESQYKFLFLFIIITSTIQSGIKHGMTVATISSIIILTIDLVYVPNVEVNKYFENDIILVGIFMLTAWPLGYYVKIENEHIKILAQLANIDGLTGVYNHRFFQDTLKSEIIKSKKLGESISLMLLDIDYFKHYNDLYGHQKGDEVLKKIGLVLKENVREKDTVARYGGEEFAIIMPDTEEEEAVFIAERIRVTVEKCKFFGEENQPNGKITVSIGISNFPDKSKCHRDLINSADDALYRAKFFNKNRVETYYSILEELKNDIEEEHIELIASIKTLISVINAKDRYTYGHIERVVMYCKLLGEELNLSESEKRILKYGAYLHDIGKINISKEILNKKMPLTDEEWGILKQHPTNGVEIIKSVDSLKNIIPLILYHHERYDGKGYPEGLKGKEIPYLSRILSIADSFDAMTSNRPYSSRRSYDDAVAEIIRCKNTQFDPLIADIFIKAVEENKDKFDSLIL